MAKRQFEINLEIKIQALCKELKRKSIPLRVEIFEQISIQDLRQLNEQLGIHTRDPIQYWCSLFAKFNMEIIKRYEIGKWRAVEGLFTEAGLSQKVFGKVYLLFIYFRLNEIDNTSSVSSRARDKKETKIHVRSLKKKATRLSKLYDDTEKLIASLSEGLSYYNQDPIHNLLYELRRLDQANKYRADTINALIQAVDELEEGERPKIFDDAEQLFYPNARNRTFEYSEPEKLALIGIESLLTEVGFSANKSANLIADIWDEIGPVREAYGCGNRKQAVRRLLKRMKDKGT